MLGGLIENIKSLLELDPAKRERAVTWVFFGIIIWYLFSENQKKDDIIGENNKTCQELITKIKESYESEIKINREQSQSQINGFIKKSNDERDSIYTYFYSELRKHKNTIQKSLNEIRDENNN